MSYDVEFSSMYIICINKDELLKRIQNGSNYILIDTIGNYDGNKLKIKSAVTIPYTEVIDRRKEFFRYNEVIVYCRNKRCKASKKVALGLNLLNIPNVKVYEGGLDEWIENKLPVEEI
ncbi:MAG: rhodanese-like domain-containing protein [Nitrospirae bacterium]|nr:rhodanese-like domain-containing protein [Nitrospirota bacterium]